VGFAGGEGPEPVSGTVAEGAVDGSRFASQAHRFACAVQRRIDVDDAFNAENFDVRRLPKRWTNYPRPGGNTKSLALLSVHLRAVLTTEQWKELQKRRPGLMRGGMRPGMRPGPGGPNGQPGGCVSGKGRISAGCRQEIVANAAAASRSSCSPSKLTVISLSPL